MRQLSLQRGFSLIEVLTAIVVFSVGLIGLGFLMTSAVRSNHVGFQHTQASFLAESILDRMRTNIRGVWSGSYDGTYSGGTATPSNTCTSSPCRSTELAQRDTWAWGQLVTTMLPTGTGTIACQRTAGVPMPSATEMKTVPTFDGVCTITIAWVEKTEGNDAAGVNQQFQWVVQP
ncbi:MAG TPA: type IV pilus modification protein PilV [Xanthomonadales bacterium]|nr:type IV pilus modification protein PilV [Xanthomonadales bacterium]